MADPEIAAIRAQIAARTRATEIAQMRKDYDARGLAFGTASDIKVEPVSANGVKAEWTSAPGADASKAILFLHGGGYVIGSLDSHRHMVSECGRAAGTRTLAIDYRMAPEHPFPAAVDDALVAYRYLLVNGIAAKNIAIAGDSAGGGLVVGAMLAIRDAGLSLPGCAWCISPWVDMEASGRSFVDRAESDPTVQAATIKFMAETYLAGANPKSVYAAPHLGDLRGLPPMLIQVGACETLLDDSVALARAAGIADVAVSLEIWPEMIHVWHTYHTVLQAGKRAIAAGGAFVKSNLGG